MPGDADKAPAPGIFLAADRRGARGRVKRVKVQLFRRVLAMPSEQLGDLRFV